MQIAFYKGTRPAWQGIFNRLVRWWTGGKYSHCEIVFTDISASSSAIDGGVRYKYILYDLNKWDIIDLPPEKFDAGMARRWFASHEGAGYDYTNLLGFIWRRQDGSDKKYTCSEACAAALGLQSPWRYDPNALFSVVSSMIK
jgi:hypothetical protein